MDLTQDERWMIWHKEVVEFLVKEHRKLSKYNPQEKLMLHFIHHNKKLYNASSMKPERKKLFEKLLALCEEYKKVNQYV